MNLYFIKNKTQEIKFEIENLYRYHIRNINFKLKLKKLYSQTLANSISNTHVLMTSYFHAWL